MYLELDNNFRVKAKPRNFKKKKKPCENNPEKVKVRQLLLLSKMEKDNLSIIYQNTIEIFLFLGVLYWQGAIYSCTAIEENICLLGF